LPDRELAVTLNRMRCKPPDGKAWTTVRVCELREQLGIEAFNPVLPRAETISAGAAATRLGICIGSVHKLIRKGVLPAAQLMPSAPWQIPVAALDTEAVKKGVCEIVGQLQNFTNVSGRIRPSGSPAFEWKGALCRPLPATTAEHEQRTAMRVERQSGLHPRRQPIKALPHISDAARQIDADIARNADHDSADKTQRNATSSTAPVRRSLTPEGSSTSIIPSAGGPVRVATAPDQPGQLPTGALRSAGPIAPAQSRSARHCETEAARCKAGRC
jgi:hypothetical protein